MAGSDRGHESQPRPRPFASDPATEPRVATSNSRMPTSPAMSDKSSDSEARPVTEKLQETRIDAQSLSDAPQGSDHTMEDIPNGNHTAAAGDQNSGSERGRLLRRKRSREDFEGMDKPLEKKLERHSRKNSRDMSSGKDKGTDNALKSPVNPISEHQDENMERTDDTASARRVTPEGTTSGKDAVAVTSPKNKRTLDQSKNGENVGIAQVDATSKDTISTEKTEDERHPKRQRDKADSEVTTRTEETKTKVDHSLPIPFDAQNTTWTQKPSTSGFANASAVSPFATMASKGPAAAERSHQEPAKTSDDKFKASGFGTFAASAASPFGGFGGSGSSSPFTAGGNGKMSSFASPKSPPTSTASGFGALGGGSTKSAFGGSSTTTFGTSLGSSTFGGFGGSKSGLSSFATPGVQAITGLSRTKVASFGAPEGKKKEESDDGSDENDSSEEDDADKTEKSKRSESDMSNLQPQQCTSTQVYLEFRTDLSIVETGEEGESSEWTGRAKLYALSGEGSSRSWQERGVGPFKLNVTNDEPRRARFVLRADGTHRLLLNVAVTPNMMFGDKDGNRPKDGRLLFSSPTADGTLEAHILKVS
jgi:Ran-binding protein 3